MKINNVLRMFFAALFLTFAVTSCEDDYSEEELLRQQNEIAAQERAAEQAAAEAAADAAEAQTEAELTAAEQAAERAAAASEAAQARLDSLQQANLAALDLAGELLDFSVTVTSGDGPVAGATIMASNINGETASAETNADGNITFKDIPMGGHTITMKSDNVVDLSFEIDFGSPEEGIHYKIIEGAVVPIETSESASISAFALSGNSTTTIKGKVTAETDVTNETPEIPQDLTIQAEFASAEVADFVEVSSTSGKSAEILAKTVSGVKIVQSDFASATVDNATGDYEMTVPVLKDSNNNTVGYDIIIPDFEAEATVAYTNDDDEVVIGSFPALFGENRGGASDNVYTTNTYTNLVANFSKPAPEGEGFTLEFEVQPRALFDDKSTPTFDDEDGDAETVSYTSISFTKGSGYTEQPSVSISGGGQESGDTKAKAFAKMEYQYKSFDIVDGGSGFAEDDEVVVTITNKYGDGTADNNDLPSTETDGLVTLTVDAVDDDGAITSVSFPEAQEEYIELDNLSTIDVAYTSNDASVDAPNLPEFSLTYEGRMKALEFTDEGENFTSIPSITIEGNATATIEEMAFRYAFTPGSVDVPYVYKPTEIGLEGFEIGETTATEEATGFVAFIDTSDAAQNASIPQDGTDLFDVEDDGTLEFNGTFTDVAAVLTNNYYTEVPTTVVENVEHVQAIAKVGPNSIDASGEFVGFVDDNGDLDSDNSDGTLGKGYVEAPTVTFTAVVDGEELDIDIELDTDDEERGKDWDGNITINDAGSDLEKDINNSNLEEFSFPFRTDDTSASPSAVSPATDPEGIDYGPLEFAPQPGQTLIRNINYGKGYLLDSSIDASVAM